MADFFSSDEEDAYYSDHDGIENDDDVHERMRPSASSSQVITKESLLAAQRKDLQTVMELLTMKEHHARTLLIHHRWNVENLLAVLVEKGRDRLFAEAGITIVEQKGLPSPYSSSLVMCSICIEDVSQEDATAMDCGHCFCNSCWTEHFIIKINEGQSRRIRCMAHKCNAICDEAVVRNLVSAKHTDLAERFDRYLLESYIEDNNKVKWCPSVPHCGNAIRVEGRDACEVTEVECACGLQFCFRCSEEAHSPCSCLMWELWAKKCRDESETVNWITVNTKPCPKCHKPVEKNGGCNLVTCICGQAFCWLCGGGTGREHTWSSIAGHSCGRYKEDRGQQAERAKRDLYRYMHYHNRYKAHTDSFKLETELKETIQAKISVAEAKESGMKDFSWLTNGLNRLFRCRRVLSYSYPFAFYMFGDDLFGDEMSKEVKELKQHLFEDQQQLLETNVERLSKFIEEPFDEFPMDKITDIRMQIINLSLVTDNLCKKMYECIENDLLGCLQGATHCIAPYNSKGVARASELSLCGEPHQGPRSSTTTQIMDTCLIGLLEKCVLHERWRLIRSLDLGKLLLAALGKPTQSTPSLPSLSTMPDSSSFLLEPCDHLPLKGANLAKLHQPAPIDGKIDPKATSFPKRAKPKKIASRRFFRERDLGFESLLPLFFSLFFRPCIVAIAASSIFFSSEHGLEHRDLEEWLGAWSRAPFAFVVAAGVASKSPGYGKGEEKS